MAGQTFAYLRASRLDQDLEQNKLDILKVANDAHLGHVQFIEEKAFSRVSWHKREIAMLLEQAGAGDALIVSELSRLGRSPLECLEILSLTTQKGIHVYAVKGNWQLDNGIQNQRLAVVFAMAAEIERDLISQRTTEGLAARKQQGLPLGRPKGVVKSKLDEYRTEIEMYLKAGATKTWIAQKCGTTLPKLSHWIKRHGIEPTI